MLLQPKKNKYRKTSKGRLRRLGFKKTLPAFGTFGLKAKTSGVVTARQLEAARKAIVKKLQRKGKLWLRVFPDYPSTRKPTESRMGKGKGSISHWGVKVCAGNILFEVCGVASRIAVEALASGGKKLPVKTKTTD